MGGTVVVGRLSRSCMLYGNIFPGGHSYGRRMLEGAAGIVLLRGSIPPALWATCIGLYGCDNKRGALIPRMPS